MYTTLDRVVQELCRGAGQGEGQERVTVYSQEYMQFVLLRIYSIHAKIYIQYNSYMLVALDSATV